MSSKHDSTSISRRRFLRTATFGLAGMTLAACGSGGGGAQPAGQTGGSTTNLKWSTWGNPGEQARFKAYTDDFNTRNPNVQFELIPLPSDYDAKMLTQLSGGTAPDVFYAGESFVSKVISTGGIIDLTEMLNGPNSKSKPEELAGDLWSAAKTADGKIYGMPVDCNPMVIWYSNKVLKDAGVTTTPADLYNQGRWSWEEFQKMSEQVVAAGKRGLIFDNWWAETMSWVSVNGGKMYDDTQFVGQDDPKTVEAFQFLYDGMQNKTITYAGGLPKGQGEDAMFMSMQSAFVSAGRWLLPTFSKNKAIEYDVVPYPTNTGNKIEPATIPTAYIVINSKTANKDAAFAFLTDFVSKEGQIFRLKGGGNAVPSIKGADEVVAEGNDPTNWQAFIETRDIGYAAPRIQAAVPGLADDLNKVFDPLWLKGGDVQATLQQAADIANAKLKQL